MVSRPWTIHHIHSVANEQYFLLPLLSLLSKRRGAKHELQGRRKLLYFRWASSNVCVGRGGTSLLTALLLDLHSESVGETWPVSYMVIAF